MALYTIYAYQFKPLAVQLDLFNKERCLEQRSELMSQKNKIFENITLIPQHFDLTLFISS
jgi:hypothetical protein|nr:MAG TPA: hypothetical protein [Caudoviricetes sp.]